MSESILLRARNIYEQQAHNKRMTALVMIVFVFFIGFIGFGFDFKMEQLHVRGVELPNYLLPLFAVAIAYSFWTFSGRVIQGLWSSRKSTEDDSSPFSHFIADDALSSKLASDKPAALSKAVVVLLFLPAAGLLIFYYANVLSAWLLHTQKEFFEPVRIQSSYPFGILAALALGIAGSLWSFRYGSRGIRWFMRATPIQNTDGRAEQLLNVVNEMSIAAGLPLPKVFVIPDKNPNAFTVGWKPEISSIIVTQGLLESMDREELQAVIAHEMGHIRNYDIRLMTVATALAGTVLLLSSWARSGTALEGVAGKKSLLKPGGIFVFVIWLLTILLAPIVAQLLAMGLSRQREYLADASAAELTRNPLALVHALRKIENAQSAEDSMVKGVAHMCIIDPAQRKVNEKDGILAEWLATHPPTRKRIILLESFAHSYTKQENTDRSQKTPEQPPSEVSTQ